MKSGRPGRNRLSRGRAQPEEVTEAVALQFALVEAVFEESGE